MFSVDNFYTIFNSHYGWPTKNNILYVFNPHGSKNWNKLVLFDVPYDKLPPSDIMSGGAFLMHDQEPVSVNHIAYLKKQLQDSTYVKRIQEEMPDNYKRFENLSKLSIHLDEYDLSHQYVRTTKVPIICHSEKNSNDIKKLLDNNWIDCYYWWHGMIARDWFRHWEKHNNLQVRNKANETYRFLIYSRDFTGTRKYREKIIDHLAKNQSQINYNWNQDYRCSTMSATISVTDANNSAIQLVAETLFDTEKIYLTEKVFKPMVMCQPFILFAPPGSLQYLRDYGFKTFNNIWNEDYDAITDSSKRKQTILDLIDSLLATPDIQFKELYQELLPIIEHNKSHFYSKEFQDVLWNELEKNCSEALQKQQELSEQWPGGTYFYYVNKILEKTSFNNLFWAETIPKIIEQQYNKNSIIKQYPALARLFENNQC